ncbi:MAG: GntR family transcriptional regulator [Ilumatobacteraceae bacterium]
MTDLDLTLDRTSPVPLYHQVAAQLRAAVHDGRVPRGSFLDNEIALAQQWHLSRPTVRRAIQDLVDAGLLVRRRGVGTQVVDDQVRRRFALSSLWDDLAAEGLEPTTAVIELSRVAADDECADALHVQPGDDVVQMVRVRAAGGQPLAVLRNWLIPEVASDLTVAHLTSRGLYDLLRERGVRPHLAFQRHGAKAADAWEAQQLGIEVGDPLVTMHRIMQDVTGRRVELTRTVYHAEHYEVETTVVEN